LNSLQEEQWVAVGRAIVREPAVFLMDEPLSNLDAKLRVQARAELSKLHQRLGTTFIYVTHDQVEAMTMGTRIAVMNAGVLQQVDTPQNLYDYPANVFVAGFIGSPAMNFFNAKLVEVDGQVCVDTGDFMVVIPIERQDIYRPHLGKEIVFGIRPEDVHDPQFAPPGIHGAAVEARVAVTELMGNEVIVYLDTEHYEFLGRFDPRTKARVGQTIRAVLDMDRMHIFDRQTEMAIR
jgi:multiple sugar transport system ATP-binding protein